MSQHPFLQMSGGKLHTSLQGASEIWQHVMHICPSHELAVLQGLWSDGNASGPEFIRRWQRLDIRASLRAVWFWLWQISLCFNFSVFKVARPSVPPSQVCWEDGINEIYEGPLTKEMLAKINYYYYCSLEITLCSFGLGGNMLAEALPVCEVVLSPSWESVAILTHIRHPTSGCLHDLKSVCVQFSSHCQSKKCLHFLKFAICKTPVLALNKMTAFCFKRVELVEICLTEKTKKGTDYRRANLHHRMKQNCWT